MWLHTFVQIVKINWVLYLYTLLVSILRFGKKILKISLQTEKKYFQFIVQIKDPLP